MGPWYQTRKYEDVDKVQGSLATALRRNFFGNSKVLAKPFRVSITIAYAQDDGDLRSLYPHKIHVQLVHRTSEFRPSFLKSSSFIILDGQMDE